MQGIDVSHYNGWPFDEDTEKAYQESDFVIVKATQGTSYSYASYFQKAIARTLQDGKLGGAYHYAAGKTPELEAAYFASIVKPCLGQIILALDWEEGMNKAWGDNDWCRRFVGKVYDLTGQICFIYTGMGGTEQCVNIATDAPLWFAGYPTDKNSWEVPKFPDRYTTFPWDEYTIWQFTSGGDRIDRNTTGMTKKQWKEFCGKYELRGYDGAFPELPSRGYYMLGDGYYQNTGLVMEIKKLQTLINWINDGQIKVDGAYGPNTVAAVQLAQTNLKVYPDGLFGVKTLRAAKGYKKHQKDH